MITIEPSKQEFIDAVKNDRILPLYAEIDKPALTPISALEALRPGGHAVLLESARVNGTTGRYSFVTAEPYLIFRSYGDTVELSLPVTPAGKYGRRASVNKKPLQKLRELLANYRTERVEGLPPFLGGAVGYFSYDFVRQFEEVPKNAKPDLDIPEAYFVFVDRVIAFDHILKKTWVIVNAGAREQEMGFRKPAADQWSRLYDEAADRLVDIMAMLDKAAGEPASTGAGSGSGNLMLKPELSQPAFESMVARCQEYIAGGDIYQANISQRFTADLGNVDPFLLYTLLRGINPSPFAAYLDFEGLQLVSSSPERLIRLWNGLADTRPIAGTRRRGSDGAETRGLSAELLTNEKERAEHIMLLDLERSDLGRVCEYGTVQVDELMVVEDYSHVIHIVSNVRGTLAKGMDCCDLVRAVFPGGTITGVPKVRCMEIIDELEPMARGPYTGSIGYFSNSGDMDLNIIIRTFVISGRKAYVQVGAGIVADSLPAREYIETLEKAEALKRAIESL